MLGKGGICVLQTAIFLLTFTMGTKVIFVTSAHRYFIRTILARSTPGTAVEFAIGVAGFFQYRLKFAITN